MIDLTPVQRKVLTLFERAALAGRPCPTNGDIAHWFDCENSTAGRIISALQDKGAIRVIHPDGGNSRLIEIVATGKRTGPTRQTRFVNRTQHEIAVRRPLAVLHHHAPCGWCGSRVDACSCAPGRAARGESGSVAA